MEGSKMFKTEYDLKAIMYPAYNTPHNVHNISGNKTIHQPRLPPNNENDTKYLLHAWIMILLTDMAWLSAVINNKCGICPFYCKKLPVVPIV